MIESPDQPFPDAPEGPEIAYFTMEIGLASELPTYSGGLGVLAGDTARGAADLGLPFVVVTLAHRAGYFRQTLDDAGQQQESPAGWRPEEHLRPLDPRVQVEVEGRTLALRGWEYRIEGPKGRYVPVILLDADLDENAESDRRITDRLYGGDRRLRLQQEIVLGIGGVRLLRALGWDAVHTFHMNEGHSSLLTLELLSEAGARPGTTGRELEEAVSLVRRRCAFTTHTPVPAGHDRFRSELMTEVLGPDGTSLLDELGLVEAGEVNMTHVALRFSRFTNGVALRHARLSREMFPGHTIHAITNGVHAETWTGEPIRRLFDRRIPGWREDPFLLRHAVALPLNELRTAHDEARATLLDEVRRRTGRQLDPERMTVAFARRATPYKRADLLPAEPSRILEVVRNSGPFQLIYAGKAHPRDEEGKAMIRRVVEAARSLGDEVPLVYLEDYDMELGGLLTAGADLWLNQPRKPLEASGTSGMKAALNGVPCLSVLDGWWIEGHVEGVTGWAIDRRWQDPVDDVAERDRALQLLEDTILPLFYGDPEGWARVMRSCIALNGSHFHVRRMLQEYVDRAYTP